ncbi:MAG: hypothetical protein OEW60_06700 [Thiovulaceae bacterium]|nr:hypothetical protein [Sulfurimonadaceae bacterium]
MIDPRFEAEPSLMLPTNLPEDLFDVIFVESLALLNAMGEGTAKDLQVQVVTNIVSDILRVFDIYDMYKENLSGLVLIYATWTILESLQRENQINYDPPTFETLFDNELLSKQLIVHHDAFKRKISSEVITT